MVFCLSLIVEVYYIQSLCFFMPEESNKRTSSSTYGSYIDTSGELGSKELGYGMWWVAHKTDLYRIAVFALGLVTLVTWIFALSRGVLYGWYTFSREPQLIADVATFSNFTNLQARFSPTPIQILETVVLPGGVDKYDLVSEVANTNAWHKAQLDYYFQVGDVTTTLQTASLAPGEERPIAFLGYEGSEVRGGATLVIQAVRWSRISNKKISNPAVYRENRVQLSVADFAFVRSETNPGVTAHSVRFTLTNNSSFSFKNPLFYVGLYNADTLVGIISLELNNLRAQETAYIDLRSFVQNLNVTDIKIFPRFDVFDPYIYLKPGE